MKRFALAVCVATMWMTGAALAADWPTYMGDAQRRGVTDESLAFPLRAIWNVQSPAPPNPSWSGPVNLPNLTSTVDFDVAFEPVIADGAVFFGSSSEETVTCLDAATGAERWVFFTEGPVRLAPTIVGGRAYVASDDGCVYCLDAKTGKMIWKHRVAPRDRRIPNNGHMISEWPVRCGVVVEGDVVYAAAGLFPTYGVYLCGMSAADGKALWTEKIGCPAQGYMLATRDWLVVPVGRTGPQIFDRKGKFVKPIPGFRGHGGSYGVMDGDLYVHPAGEGGGLFSFQPTTGQYLVLSDGRRILLSADVVYVLGKDGVSAMDRKEYLANKKPAPKWTAKFEGGWSMIRAGERIIVGAENRIFALNVADGKEVWSAQVRGTVHGLAVANGQLVASTNTGGIYCFGKEPEKAAGTTQPAAAAPAEPAGGRQGRRGDRPAEQAAPAVPVDGKVAESVKELLKLTKERKGYCLVVGAGDGQFALELARQTKFSVVVAEKDAAKVAAAREMLRKAGVYGTRVSMQQVEEDALPYCDGFANVVVPNSGDKSAADELSRVTHPCGGVVIPGAEGKTAGMIRSRVKGAGEWTHLYGDAGNSGCSGDALVKGKFDMQWFGEPGPKPMADRHLKNKSPLVKDGRMFVPGVTNIICVDAYNGTILWTTDVAQSDRFRANRDCSSMAVAEDYLYVAGGPHCYLIDVRTGRQVKVFSVPEDPEAPEQAWGYVAVVGDVLFGSVMAKGGAFRAERPGEWGPWGGPGCSEKLFAMDRRSGKVLWTYEPEAKRGLIPNPTLAAGGGRVYFIESADADTRKGNGRAPVPMIVEKGTDVVALDAKKGKVAWRKAADLKAAKHALYLQYSDEMVVVTGTYSFRNEAEKVNYAKYEMWAFGAKDGAAAWHVLEPENVRMSGHGEEELHPVIVKGVVYTNPLGFDLKTGAQVPKWKWQRGGHGCGTLSACDAFIFNRGGQSVATEISTGEMRRLTVVSRPGCWINIIPAGGLVLVPETSSGCLCPFTIQTSYALTPVK